MSRPLGPLSRQRPRFVLVRLGVHEGPRECDPPPPKGGEVVFDRSTTRFLHCVPTIRRQSKSAESVTVSARFSKLDGNIIRQVDSRFLLEPSWTSFTTDITIGWDEPGQWQSGHYRIDLTIDGEAIGHKLFVIESHD